MALGTVQNTRNSDFDTDLDASAVIAREKKAFNLIYGALAGTAFALSLWGGDALRLSQAHALFPWLKLLLGIAICAGIGLALGWLVARTERGWVGFFAWIGAAAAFSWLAIGLQLQIVPVFAKALEPSLNGLVDYGIGGTDLTKFWVALVWTLIFLSVAGILQKTLLESAVFATSLLARVAPFLLCILLTVVAGAMLDDLVNAPFRNAIVGVDTPIQFILQHEGQEVDAAEARRVHAGALNAVLEYMTSDYKLIVGSHNDGFGLINVLVRFGDTWVTCSTANGHANYCELVDTP